MKKDKLEDTIIAVEKWCHENDISIFYGNIEKSTLTKVNWNNDSCDGWENYLITLIKSDSKILIIDTLVNDIDIGEEEIATYKEKAEDEERHDFNESFVTIQKNKELIVYFELDFFYNNVCYEYAEYADWFEDYMTVMSAVDKIENETIHNNLSDEKIEELARKILSDQKYLSTQNFVSRSEIARIILEKEGVDNVNLYAIKRKAELIYDSEIKPKLDEEIKRKILELKAKRLTKIQIASQLGISRERVNKFYYSDES